MGGRGSGKIGDDGVGGGGGGRRKKKHKQMKRIQGKGGGRIGSGGRKRSKLIKRSGRKRIKEDGGNALVQW